MHEVTPVEEGMQHGDLEMENQNVEYEPKIEYGHGDAEDERQWDDFADAANGVPPPPPAH